MTTYCDRCRRPLYREPVLVGGKKLGPKCAEKVGDLLSQPQPRAQITSRRRTRRADSRQPALFTEVT